MVAVIDGREISSEGSLLMTIGGGVAGRDVAAIGAVLRESVPFPSFGRPPTLVVSLAVGLSRCSTGLGFEGGVDDDRGVGINTLRVEGAC